MLVDAEHPGSKGARAACGGYLRCVQCGAVFDAGRVDRRYCSGACRAAASRERKADKLAEQARELADLVGRLQRLTGRS
jgi:predicted nucleic acid-binding Zn ribbon protein